MAISCIDLNVPNISCCKYIVCLLREANPLGFNCAWIIYIPQTRFFVWENILNTYWSTGYFKKSYKHIGGSGLSLDGRRQ